MKKAITLLFIMTMSLVRSQVVADFETFTLSANSYYINTNSVDWQTTNAIFRYDWDTSFGGFWSEGSAYTNKNDSVNGGFANLYNCIAGKGYNNSNFYATCQNKARVVLKSPQNTVLGFYVTNTTYAWKSMKSGDSFAKKFGGASGNDPDWFKIIVKGYQNGALKADSSTFYLADHRFSDNSQDYIVKNWQWVDVSNLGVVDSIKILMSSSDYGSFGMNTPGFFSIDNFTTSQIAGINEVALNSNFNIYPNPVSSELVIRSSENVMFERANYKIENILGQELMNGTITSNDMKLEVSELANGIYFIQLNGQRVKFVKN